MVKATQREKRRLKGADKIGLRVGSVLNRYKVGKHFRLEISEDSLRYERDQEKIDQEAEFYGAMDGAAKFVRGDAIAALLITFINIIGGFIIGVAQRGMSFPDSIKTYTLLTVGDGLVSQVPALVISTAAGVIITRASSESHLGFDIGATGICGGQCYCVGSRRRVLVRGILGS